MLSKRVLCLSFLSISWALISQSTAFAVEDWCYSESCTVVLGETKDYVREWGGFNPNMPGIASDIWTWSPSEPHRGSLLEVRFHQDRVASFTSKRCYIAPAGQYIEANQKIGPFLAPEVLGSPESLSDDGNDVKVYRWLLRNQYTCLEPRRYPEIDLTEFRTHILEIRVNSGNIESISLSIDMNG